METNPGKSQERTLLAGILHYTGVLLHYKWLIAVITALSLVAVTAYCLISMVLPPRKSPLPNVYTAQAIILIEQSGQSDISETVLAALGISPTNTVRTDNGELVMEVLHSRSLLDRIIEEMDVVKRYGITKNLKGTARKVVLSHLTLSYTRTTGFFRISYTDIDPVFCRDVANRVVSLLDEWFNLNRGLAKQKQRDILAAKLGEVNGDIGTLQFRLKALQKKYGVLTAEDLGQTQAALLANLRSQLILKEIEIKNYSTFSKVNDTRLEQLNEERKNLLDLISQNQTNLTDLPLEGAGPQKTLPDVAQEFSQLTAELDIQQRIYNTLSSQLEAAKLSPGSEAIFSVFEMAETPDVKSGPRRTQYILIAAGGGFIFSVLLAFALNGLRAFMNDPEKMKLLRLKR